MSNFDLPNVPPGEVLLHDFMKPLGLKPDRVGADIHSPVGRLNAIISGKRGISPDTALRWGQYFSVSPEFWMNLQARYDLMEVRRSSAKFKIKPPRELATAD